MKMKSLSFSLPALLLLLIHCTMAAQSEASVETTGGALALGWPCGLVPLISCKSIFLLAGQSNMAGRGGTFDLNRWDQYTPPECQPDPSILLLNDEALWEEAREPLHQNISFNRCKTSDRPLGVGPGMPFANTILQRDPTFWTIGLVPTAVGGTNLSEWVRGSCLYDRLLARARASLREGGSIRAMLWYQGENDTNKDNSDTYEDMLKAFFNDVRADLMSPSLPIIQVALASPENAYLDKIRSVQLNLDLPNVKCVDAKGLPLQGDHLHLTTDAQVKLGSMLADAFLNCFT